MVKFERNIQRSGDIQRSNQRQATLQKPHEAAHEKQEQPDRSQRPIRLTVPGDYLFNETQ